MPSTKIKSFAQIVKYSEVYKSPKLYNRKSNVNNKIARREYPNMIGNGISQNMLNRMSLYTW